MAAVRQPNRARAECAMAPCQRIDAILESTPSLLQCSFLNGAQVCVVRSRVCFAAEDSSYQFMGISREACAPIVYGDLPQDIPRLIDRTNSLVLQIKAVGASSPPLYSWHSIPIFSTSHHSQSSIPAHHHDNAPFPCFRRCPILRVRRNHRRCSTTHTGCSVWVNTTHNPPSQRARAAFYDSERRCLRLQRRRERHQTLDGR